MELRKPRHATELSSYIDVGRLRSANHGSPIYMALSVTSSSFDTPLFFKQLVSQFPIITVAPLAFDVAARVCLYVLASLIAQSMSLCPGSPCALRFHFLYPFFSSVLVLFSSRNVLLRLRVELSSSPIAFVIACFLLRSTNREGSHVRQKV